MGSAYVYVNNLIGGIKTLPGSGETPTGLSGVGSGGPPQTALPGASGLHPENILLIGNQTRQGLTPAQQLQYGTSLGSGSLADIMMVLHLDPTTGTASILSIPRDLFAPMPAGSAVGPFQKIDAALNNGADGPNNLVNAIQDDLGIPINHFVELNFNGFINTVNALHGINVYFPERLWDAESLLWVPKTGCVHLDGWQALTLVRARHLQYDPPGDNAPRYDWPQEPLSDLARIGRTHTFLKILFNRAKSEGLTNPLAANAFLSAVADQLTVDPALKPEMIKLVLHYRNLNVGAVHEATLPATYVNNYYYNNYVMGDVLFPVQPVDNNVIRAWDPEVFANLAKPSSVSVQSITGSYQAALAAGQALASDGLNVSGESVGTVPSPTTETWVLYHSTRDISRAMYVMKYLSGSVMMQLDPAVPAGTVQVQLGSVVSVRSGTLPGTSTSTTLAGAVPTTTTTLAPTSTSTSSSTTTTSTTSTTPATSTTTASGASVPSTSASTTTSTTVPTPGGSPVSSAKTQVEPWDPRAC